MFCWLGTYRKVWRKTNWGKVMSKKYFLKSWNGMLIKFLIMCSSKLWHTYVLLEKVSLILRTSNLLKIRKQLALLLNIDLTKKTPNLRMILLKILMDLSTLDYSTLSFIYIYTIISIILPSPLNMLLSPLHLPIVHVPVGPSNFTHKTVTHCSSLFTRAAMFTPSLFLGNTPRSESFTL